MIKIGLIGEDPNDTNSIKYLLNQKLEGNISFIQLVKNKRGYQLDNLNTLKSLKIEFEDKDPDLVLFIRDADAIVTEIEKINEKQKWFKKMLAAVSGKGILLLNIYELEALILYDIETFNKLFHVNISYNKNVMFQKEPKEFLTEKTYKSKRRYFESDCPEIFKKLKFELIYDKCTYFKDFYENLTLEIGKLK